MDKESPTTDRPRKLMLDIHSPGAWPKPNDFLRTRLKSGTRIYLVETVRQVKRKDPAAFPRLAITMFRTDPDAYAQREPDQHTHWFNWYPSRKKKANT